MASAADSETGFRLLADSDAVVRLDWVPGVRIDGSLAVAAIGAVDDLNGDQERPLLVDMGSRRVD